MNFGYVSGSGIVLAILVWLLPLALLVWFVRTLSAIAASLRDIVLRLDSLERAVRDAPRSAPSNER